MNFRIVRSQRHWKASTGWIENPKFLNTKRALIKTMHAQEALDLTEQYLMKFFPDQVQGAMHLVLYLKTIAIMCGDYD